MHEDYKQKVVTEYKAFYDWANEKQIPQSIIDQFKECERYMLSEDLSKQWKNFEKETVVLNEMSGESVGDVFEF